MQRNRRFRNPAVRQAIRHHPVVPAEHQNARAATIAVRSRPTADAAATINSPRLTPFRNPNHRQRVRWKSWRGISPLTSGSQLRTTVQSAHARGCPAIWLLHQACRFCSAPGKPSGSSKTATRFLDRPKRAAFLIGLPLLFIHCMRSCALNSVLFDEGNSHALSHCATAAGRCHADHRLF